ncbi:PEP-CTERM sorting domain-containing protein [Rubripirellula amarantea]|nr:PEP-CTERM sorting domain-containing protein [Rubripirellula amarantea]
MRKKLLMRVFMGLMFVGTICSSAGAAIVTISALDVRSGGVFGHPNASAVTINGVAASGPTVTADPLDIQITYSMLDLDGDSTANDEVTFTLRATKFGPDGGSLRIFNQGIDTGFGNLNDVELSVINVTGTTTDAGNLITFNGFTGATAGAGVGAGIDISSSVEINGTAVTLASPDNGGFRFVTATTTFAPTATVQFDNSVNNNGGTIVARSYDLQFDAVAVPEPSSLAVLGLGAVGIIAVRRRRRR